MKNSIMKLTFSAALMATLVACGDSGGSSGDSAPTVTSITPTGSAFVQELDKVGDTSAATVTTRMSSRFEFPALETSEGSTKMTVPAGPLPGFSARRTLSNGAGAPIGYGDNVSIQYDMFSWSTGELVESTARDGANLSVTLAENGNVPEYLVDSLMGRKSGEKFQIVFRAGMEDLPDYLNGDDAYILIVKVL